MVYPVMRGGDEDIFQPAHLSDQLRMDKDAPDLGGGVHKDDVQGFEPQKCERYKIDKSIQRLKHGTPEAYREVQVLGRMVRYVHRPEKTDLVVPAVQPVVEEVFRQQQQKPIRKYAGNGYPVMTIAKVQDIDVYAPEQEIDTAV